MDTLIPIITRENTCGFSGYRPEKLPWRGDETDARCLRLKADIDGAVDSAYADGMRHFVCGMARGCDMYFCESVMALRSRTGGVTVEAAVPHERQSAGWPAEDAARYDRLLALCDIRTVVSAEYSRGAMSKRNRYMVNRSSTLIAVYDGQTGGTSYTVSYAKKRGVRLIVLAPSLLL
ncbi:MAG: SLOG family protein [Oscillospiraceae bacterium]|nr:SLOG family protein [Oscillospiraceae bacterium]